jgi:hypothetical protein
MSRSFHDLPYTDAVRQHRIWNRAHRYRNLPRWRRLILWLNRPMR